VPQVDPSRVLPGYAGDPIAITAQVLLNPNDSLDLSADALRNVLGARINLSSLRWTIDAQQKVTGTADPPTSVVGFPGLGITMSMKFGGKTITASEIPIFCLGRAVGQDVEHVILGVAESGNTETLLGAYASGVWDFDNPFTVDMGEAITVHLSHRGLLNLPVLVSLAFTGRGGPDLPSSKWLPYAAAWTPPALDPTTPTAGSPTVVTSSERDLINQSGSPLYVSKFVGRLLRLGVTGAPLGGSNVVQNAEQVFPPVAEGISGQPNTEWFPGAVDSFLTLTLRDSRANDNVPVALPFRQVFEPESRTWECPHILDPSAYYIAQLSLSVPAVKDASIQPAIAMIGSWEGG
jgi:hypothetical protein